MCCFDAVLPMFFVHFCGSSPEKHQRKILSLSGLGFLRLVLSVLGFSSVSSLFALFLSVLLSSSSSVCLSKRERSGSHRSHAHSPLHVLGPGSFSVAVLPLGRCVVFCSHPFRRASFFFWRFVGGVFFASVRFWDSLGTRALLRFRASDPVSWTLGGGVFGVSPSVVFVFPCLLCLRPHTCF